MVPQENYGGSVEEGEGLAEVTGALHRHQVGNARYKSLLRRRDDVDKWGLEVPLRRMKRNEGVRMLSDGSRLGYRNGCSEGGSAMKE